MKSDEIDHLCRDWLFKHYPRETADQYDSQSLLMAGINPVELNEAIDDLLGRLSECFGPEETFASTDYYEARLALGLTDDRTAVPGVFLEAFDEQPAGTGGTQQRQDTRWHIHHWGSGL